MAGSSQQNAQISSSSQSFGSTNGYRTGTAPQDPQIYTAMYSGVPVYEMEIREIAVMRRRADSWLNATQILKVAGVEKGRRTKILEKEIHVGQHEKVQGGYGRYQGTWISYERGRQFCREYGVEDILKPLLDYDIISDGTGATGKNDTPTKEQAMAANRKRFYNSGIDSKANGQPASGTFFQNISPTASNALAAMNKAARFEPRPGSGHRRPPTLVHQSSSQLQQLQNSQESVPNASQSSMRSDNAMANGGSQNAPGGLRREATFGDSQEPPRKRMRPSSSQGFNGHLDPSLRENTPTEPNESFVYTQHGVDVDQGPITLPPMPPPGDRASEDKRQALMDLFADRSRSDFSNHPAITQLTAKDLDIPLDTSANTALHWAATLAKVQLLRLLISKGANMFQGNIASQTPLMAAVQVNNCWDNSCFPEMLDTLGPLIDIRDASGRTVLHHIAVSCGVKGRAQSSRYYLEALLEYTVREGSRNNNNNSQSQNQSQNQSDNSQQYSFNGEPSMGNNSSKRWSLGRFMSEVINVQDKSGNTALNLVARIGNRIIIDQLEEVGADFDIPNGLGFRPTDFGVLPKGKTNNLQRQHSHGSQGANGAGAAAENGEESSQDTTSSQLEQIKEEIFATTQSILTQTTSNYQTELTKKQSHLDAQHTELRTIAQQHSDERARFEGLQHRARDRQERGKRVENLKRAIEEMKARRRHRRNAHGASEEEGEEEEKENETSKGQQQQQHLLKIDPTLLEEKPYDAAPSSPSNNNSPESPTTRTTNYLSTLPPPSTLSSLITATSTQNTHLTDLLDVLRARSTTLEAQYRRVVALCTGVTEEEIDDQTVQGLLNAVESEREIEAHRLEGGASPLGQSNRPMHVGGGGGGAGAGGVGAAGPGPTLQAAPVFGTPRETVMGQMRSPGAELRSVREFLRRHDGGGNGGGAGSAGVELAAQRRV
ncbi:MAG: transcriptional regulator swi6 [Alyxoria varia]|nr:MAG: transcriptional regulator swi6 [Alyxoria varia]